MEICAVYSFPLVPVVLLTLVCNNKQRQFNSIFGVNQLQLLLKNLASNNSIFTEGGRATLSAQVYLSQQVARECTTSKKERMRWKKNARENKLQVVEHSK